MVQALSKEENLVDKVDFLLLFEKLFIYIEKIKNLDFLKFNASEV